MYSDKKILHTIGGITLAVLLLAFVLPGENSGRVLSSLLLLPLAASTVIFVKKRSILSMHKNEVLLIMSVGGVVYLTLYFLTGLGFGFVRNIYIFSLSTFFNFLLPVTVIIVFTEIIRSVILAQCDKTASVLCYLSCVLAEVLFYGNLYYVNSFNRFMDFVGLTLLPALVSNLLYHYISKRYGVRPNVVYRLITTSYLYLIPYLPGMSDSLYSLYMTAFPIIIYLFVNALYEKRKKRAIEKKSKLSRLVTLLTAALVVLFVMLLSNQFYFGVLVIATPSMTGEINVGDAAIFEKYGDQTIVEGQVIVFEDDGSMIVHRVVEIEKINGGTRYYTKGDYNEDMDSGFVSDGDIVGLVRFKVPFVGHPTLWLRSLFTKKG